MPQLYLVSTEGGMPVKAGTDMGVQASFAGWKTTRLQPEVADLLAQVLSRLLSKRDIMIMDVAAKKFTQVTDFDGMDSWPHVGPRRFHLFRQRSRRQRPDKHLACFRKRRQGRQGHVVQIRRRALAVDRSDGGTIVFEHDFGIWKLDVTSKRTTAIALNIDAETQENLTETMSFNSQADDYDLAPSSRRIAFSTHGEIFTAG